MSKTDGKASKMFFKVGIPVVFILPRLFMLAIHLLSTWLTQALSTGSMILGMIFLPITSLLVSYQIHTPIWTPKFVFFLIVSLCLDLLGYAMLWELRPNGVARKKKA